MGWKTGIFGILGGVSFGLLAFAYADLALLGGRYVQPILGGMTVVAAAAIVFSIVAFRTRSTSGRVRRIKFTPPKQEPVRASSPVANVHGTLAYEEASTLVEPLKHVPVANPEITLHSSATNVLCGTCGSFFQVDLDAVRPVAVDCQVCNVPLVLEGRARRALPLELRCRGCHAANHVPKGDGVAGYQCASCGQVNQLRAVGEAKPRMPLPTPKAGQSGRAS